jgi:hypothetical protein
MPSSKTRCRSTRSFLLLGCIWNESFCGAGAVRTSSPGVPKDRPSTDMKTCRPLPVPLPLARRKLLRHEGATPRARAALAVSHDFGGLLQRVSCRSVAPCNRSWGSPRCWARASCSTGSCVAAGPHRSRSCGPFPWRPTLRSVPLVTSSASCHHDRYLLAVTVGSGGLRAGVATCTQIAFSRQPDLKVLFQCRVRCHIRVWPPGCGSMLPWACSLKTVSLAGFAPAPARGVGSMPARDVGNRSGSHGGGRL